MDVVHLSWVINCILLIFLQRIIQLCAINLRTHTQSRTNINSAYAQSKGPIMSPLFPSPYKKGTKHKYRIQGDKMIINIKFISFDVGTVSQKSCVDDYVLVTYADERSQKLCGRSNHTITAYLMLTLDLYSAPNRLAGKVYRGFHAIYSFSKIPTCRSKTYTQRKSMSGTIKSPGYPLPGYPPEIVCFYNIISNPGYSVHLFFHDLDILPTEEDSCYKDYLDIFVIRFKRNSRKLWKRLCGVKKNYHLVSNTTNIHLKFKTETNKDHRGFEVDYRFVKNKGKQSLKSSNSTSTTTQSMISSLAKKESSKTVSHSKNTSSVCGETDHKGFSGSLKFEVKSSAYYNECMWSIQVPQGWHLLIIFAKFQIGLDDLCKDKYILLYDGIPEPQMKPIAKLCGERDKVGKEFMSSSRIIVIKLITQKGRLLPNENFQINWSAFLRVSIPCRGFTCAGGKVCIDRAGLSCRELPQRCLHESVKCDGIRNCGTEDDSDENGCISDAVRYSVLGATCFLFLLFLVSTIVILKSRASERTCSCTNTSPQQGVNSPTARNQGGKNHRFNGSINRDVIEMTSLSTTRLPMSSGLASSRHRYSYEVIVNQEAIRASEEPAM